MNTKRIKDLYYTAKQASEVLGLSYDTFQNWVRDGRVKRTMLPDRKLGLYLRSEIDYKAGLVESALLAVQARDLRFMKASRESLEKEMELAVLVFGEDTRSFDQYRLAFFEKSPAMFYHLYDCDQLVASINVVPIRHECISRFIAGERGWLMAECIDDLVPGKSYDFIIIDMLTTPLVPQNRRTYYAGRLFTGLSKVLESWGAQGIEIESFHANGGTLEGRRLLETAGFTKVAEHGRRLIYELFVAQANLRILDGYKQELAQWKSHQNSLSELADKALNDETEEGGFGR
jgi:hypothetical protein